MRRDVLSAHGVTHCMWAGRRLIWEGPTQPAGGSPAPPPPLDGGSHSALQTSLPPASPSCVSPQPGGKMKPALPRGCRMNSGDTGERQLCPSAVPPSHARRGGAARPGQQGAAVSQPCHGHSLRGTCRGPRGLRPLPSALGLGCGGRSARHQRRSAFTLEHVTGPQVSATSHRPQRALVSTEAESWPPPHFQGGGCISED